MDHTVLVQMLLSTCEHKRYLETNVGDGAGFARIRARHRVGLGSGPATPLVASELGDQCVYREASVAEFVQGADGQVFDVILVAGVHEWRQALGDIEASIEVLAPDGVLVVHGCNPSADVMGLPPTEWDARSPDVRTVNAEGWTGDVWKAIVSLRSSRDDLLIRTLDCDDGCAIVTRGTPDSTLAHAPDDVQALTWDNLAADRESLLNLVPSADWVPFFRAHRSYGMPEIYIRDHDHELAQCIYNRYHPGEPGVATIDDGVILPITGNSIATARGGVCDKDGTFVTCLERRHNRMPGYRTIKQAYPVSPEEITASDATVVFGGVIDDHFGHMMVDGMSRWWYLAQDDFDGVVAFVMRPGSKLVGAYHTLLQLLGIGPDRVIVVDRPTRFARVIVPDQTLFSYDGFTDHALDAFTKIRNSVKPAGHEKVYLTRTQFKADDTINEEYFERFFAAQGFAIVAPEKLPLPEQISVIAGAREIACLQGTLSHFALFARPGTAVTILTRAPETILAQRIVNQVAQPRVAFVDVSMDFLPTIHAQGAFLLMTTPEWKSYLSDHHLEPIEDDLDPRAYVADYAAMWARHYRDTPQGFNKIKDRNLLDVLELLCRYLLGERLDRRPYEAMYAATEAERAAEAAQAHPDDAAAQAARALAEAEAARAAAEAKAARAEAQAKRSRAEVATLKAKLAASANSSLTSRVLRRIRGAGQKKD